VEGRGEDGREERKGREGGTREKCEAYRPARYIVRPWKEWSDSW